MCHRKKLKKENIVDKDLIDLIVEEYRFLKSYISLMSRLMKDELPKYQSIYDFHVNRINEILSNKQLKIVDLVGKKYDEGLSVNPLNIEDFDKNDSLIIDQFIEPLIVSVNNGTIIKSGTVMLAKEKIIEEEGK